MRDWALIAILAAFSFVHFSTQPLENSSSRATRRTRRAAWASRVSCVLSFGVGSLGAWAGGLVADAAGGRLEYVFLLLAGAGGGLAAALAHAARRSATLVWRPRRPSGGLAGGTLRPAGGSPPGTARVRSGR